MTFLGGTAGATPPLAPAALSPHESVGHDADFTAGTGLAAPVPALPGRCRGCGGAVTYRVGWVAIADYPPFVPEQMLLRRGWWSGDEPHRCAA